MQHPATALFPRLPNAAIAEGLADHVLGVDALARLVRRITSGEVAGRGADAPSHA